MFEKGKILHGIISIKDGRDSNGLKQEIIGLKDVYGHGNYVNMGNIFSEFNGKKVKITIEEF